MAHNTSVDQLSSAQKNVNLLFDRMRTNYNTSATTNGSGKLRLWWVKLSSNNLNYIKYILLNERLSSPWEVEHRQRAQAPHWGGHKIHDREPHSRAIQRNFLGLNPEQEILTNILYYRPPDAKLYIVQSLKNIQRVAQQDPLSNQLYSLPEGPFLTTEDFESIFDSYDVLGI